MVSVMRSRPYGELGATWINLAYAYVWKLAYIHFSKVTADIH